MTLVFDNNNIMKIQGFIIFILTCFFPAALISQADEPVKSPGDTTTMRQIYERNITRATIQGVYIPFDLYDAVKRLEALSPEESLEKFRNAPEEGIDRKLHFGLGRWMIVNWNFYEGSRLSHYLRQMGITYPEDMANFLIVCFHRYINGKDLDAKNLAQKYIEARRSDLLERKKIVDPAEIPEGSIPQK